MRLLDYSSCRYPAHVVEQSLPVDFKRIPVELQEFLDGSFRKVHSIRLAFLQIAELRKDRLF